MRRLLTGLDDLARWALVPFAALALVGCGASASPVATADGEVAPASPDAEACDLEPGVAYEGPIAIESVNVEAIETAGAAPSACDPSVVVRRALEAELAAFDWAAAGYSGERDGQLTMTASIVELTLEDRSSFVVASSTVTTTLIHDKQGLVAALRGRAHAEDERSAGDRAERSALDAAARGSLRGLPAALESVQ